MPNFPRYESKGRLTTQLPAAEAVASTEGQILESRAKMGEAVSDNAVKWTSALDTIQRTTSLANFKTGMLDIQTRAANDPNYNNSDQYVKEIEKLRTDSLKGFASKTAETEMALNLGYESKVGQIEIDRVYKHKAIGVFQENLSKLIDGEIESPSGYALQNIQGYLNTGISDGLLDRADAYKIYQESERKVKYNSFLTDMNQAPAIAEEKLSKNEYGFNLNQLDKARNVYDAESKKIQAASQNSVLEAYLSGQEIRTDQIIQLMHEKKIDAKFAENMINKLNDPNPDSLSRDEAYIEFQNRGAEALAKGDKASVEEIVKLMTDTMQAHSQGLLDKSDVDRILKDRNELVQKKLEQVAENVLSKTNPKTFLERISFWSDEYADKKPEIKARMYRKLIDGMRQGEDGSDLLSKIVDDEIEIKMSDNLKTPDRTYAVNPDTKKRIYSDDGGATWFDEKTGKEIK